MTSYTVRPISDRTQFKGGGGTYSDFTVTWSKAERLLLTELANVRARHVVLELDFRESQLRIDGRPKATTKAASRAVRLVFETPDGATATFATDKFVGRYYDKGMGENWQHNVYAIAKGLEGLRMLKRYGISERDELYAGFKALPGGQAMGASSDPPMPRDKAAYVIALMAYPDADPVTLDRLTESIAAVSLPPHEADARAATIKRAKRNAHPDRHAGNHDRWTTLAPALAVFGAA